MAIQNFLPLNTLDKGEFVFCRFDAVGDSPSYPIVQMPIITQANWQNRLITSIIAIGAKDDDSVYTPLLSQQTSLFLGYDIMDNAYLKYYTITLKTAKNVTIVDNWPLTLLANFTADGNPIYTPIRQKKTDFSVSLDNSFITRHSDAPAISTSIVIPFYIQYK